MRILSLYAYAFASTFRLKDLMILFKDAETILTKDLLIIQFPKSLFQNFLRDEDQREEETLSAPTASEGSRSSATATEQARRQASVSSSHAAAVAGGFGAGSKGEVHESMCFAFDFGALVFIDADTTFRDHIVNLVRSQLEPEPHAPLTEDFLLEIREGAPIEVKFDRVVLPSITLPSLEIICLLLAQSAAMDYYNRDVQEISSRTDKIIHHLQLTGKLPGQIPDIIKFIGTCIATKNDVIATLALFDKPDSTWEIPEIDRLYNALRSELEIQDRFRSLEARLRMIQENLVILVDLSKNRSTLRLEITVALLILVEIVIMLWQTIGSRFHT